MQAENRENVSSDSFGSQESTPAARMNGLSYSKLMHGLKLAGVEVNRKMLSEMAISDPEGFASLVEVAKSKLA